MIHYFKAFIPSILIIISIIGCSATQETSTTQTPNTKASDIPSWFQQTTFTADSTSYMGYGEAVASDSTTAIQNAKLQARANMESGISRLIEDARVKLSGEGNELADSPDFLITIRNASQKLENEGAVTNQIAVLQEGYYRGFATVNISKTEARNMIRDGLAGKQNYLDALNSTNLFE